MEQRPLLALARAKVASGDLPDPALATTVGGRSAGGLCALCGEAIDRGAAEIELEAAGQRSAPLHPICCIAWLECPSPALGTGRSTIDSDPGRAGAVSSKGYEVAWEGSSGFYAHFTGWVTPESAARVARELAADRRYHQLRYAIIDLTDSPGHTFRRDDKYAVGNAMAEAIGAAMSHPSIVEIAIATDRNMLNFLKTYGSLTTRRFCVFSTLAEARQWLANH